MEGDTEKPIVIIYHKNCPDGSVARWAAWKRFGDSASYLGCFDRNVQPENLGNKEVYVVDFCFNKAITDELVKISKRYVVIDHHVSDKETVESLKEHVFSLEKSGAYLAWEYFHPGVEVPQITSYVSDGDLWQFELPSSKEVLSYVHAHNLDNENIDVIEESLRNEKEQLIKTGAILRKQFEKQVEEHVEKAALVSFEGYEIYACNASSVFRSELGNLLAKKKGPFSIIYRYEKDVLRVSLRSIGDFDVTTITKKYGGGGHKNAGAMILYEQKPLPFVTVVETGSKSLPGEGN